MPLNPDQEKAAAEQYLQKLSTDADARQRFADTNSSDPEAVAAEVGSTLGMDVHASNVPGMAAHLAANHPEALAALGAAHPALGSLIYGDEAAG